MSITKKEYTDKCSVLDEKIDNLVKEIEEQEHSTTDIAEIRRIINIDAGR